MRILITGVAGHVGSRFAEWVLENQPHVDIVGIDNLCCGYRQSVPVGVEFYEWDLATADLAPLFEAPFSAVFHMAAYAAECLSPFIRRYNYANNLLATANVINGMLNGPGGGRLVFTSSMAVYGRGEPPFAESDLCQPIDPYGVAKLACEMDLRIAGDQHALDWCVLRPHNIYGPGQSLWQRYRNVLGLWMRAALEQRPLRVYGDGSQLRAFSYIDDVLPCLWAAAFAAGASRQIINLGGANPISIQNAAEMLADITGHAQIQHLEPRHEVQRAWCTVEESQELLGYRERNNLATGMRHMWRWAQEAWQRWPERRTMLDEFELEVTRQLYAYWQEEPAHEPAFAGPQTRRQAHSNGPHPKRSAK